MREIKFRGKGHNGEWVYGSLVYSNNIDTAIRYEICAGTVRRFDWCYVDSDTVGQYTGLKDKNDKDIYEGDGVVMTVEEAVLYINENIEDDKDLQEKWEGVDKDWMEDIADFIRDEMGIQECKVAWQEEKSSISKNTGAFITKRACKEYIEKYRYNHSNPQTYALTAYRNHELERLLNILKNLE